MSRKKHEVEGVAALPLTFWIEVLPKVTDADGDQLHLAPPTEGDISETSVEFSAPGMSAKIGQRAFSRRRIR